MADTLRLAPGLDLPTTFATEGVVAVGMRGSGKSNTLVRWAEVLYKARIPFVAIDPKGDWGGIRSSADGKKPGLAVPVFGGLTGDFPLDEHLGARIADLLVDNNMSAVLDVSRLSLAARGRFLTDFCNQLMDRHQVEPHVRCVILEEAHRYIPQQTNKDTARVKEAAAAVLLEGRAFGLGCWAATQRPARLHKDVLEEVGTAILHRIGAAATNDLRTIAGWVKHEELSDEIVPSLTKLQSGEAWVLAPSTLGIAKRVKIDRRTTYDSASTPLVGAGSRPTVTMADIDAAAIKDALADTIEKAKAADPKELQKRIRQLERELASQVPQVEHVEVPVEVEVPKPYVPEQVGDALLLIRDALERAEKAVASAPKAPPDRPGGSTTRNPPPRREPVAASARPVRPAPTRTPSSEGAAIPKGERAILVAVAQHAPVTREALTVLTGYKRSSRDTYLQRLGAAGYVEARSGEVVATDAGIAALGDYEPLPTGAELQEWWLGRLPAGEVKILETLIAVYPDGLTRDEISDQVDYKRSSRDTYIQRLAVKKLVTTGPEIRAADTLFDG